jgi:hypothetical protein
VARGLLLAAALFAALPVLSPSPAFGRTTGLGVPLIPSETSWLSAGALGGHPYRLSSEPWIGLLERYLEPFRNHTPEWRSLYRGSYGFDERRWLPELGWNAGESFAGSLGELLSLPRPELLPVVRTRYCPAWKRPRPVLFLSGREADRIALLDCDGSLSSDGLDRLSVLARPPGVGRPDLPLPLEPDADGGEWVSDVRLLNPRLAWAVSRIAEAFPGRAIEITSGYRRGGHDGHHSKGRALDLIVRGVAKEAVFQVCRELRDAGCGYYPQSPFVHLDVRPYGSGHVAWVDASSPGEPSRYVDGWPGVLSRSGRSLPGP